MGQMFSEAIVLRVWPLREADLLVELMTRAEGRIKGVARSALKSRKRFGGALEPLTLVRARWDERERRDLARLDNCEIIYSQLGGPVTFGSMTAVQHIVEILGEAMPEREVNDHVFRLAWTVAQCVKAEEIWAPVLYFELWMVQLMGLLPSLKHCTQCGRSFVGADGAAWSHPLADGIFCRDHRRPGSGEICAESLALADRILRSPIDGFLGVGMSAKDGGDLRRALQQIIERHLDRKLRTVMQLERIEPAEQSTPEAKGN